MNVSATGIGGISCDKPVLTCGLADARGNKEAAGSPRPLISVAKSPRARAAAWSLAGSALLVLIAALVLLLPPGDAGLARGGTA